MQLFSIADITIQLNGFCLGGQFEKFITADTGKEADIFINIIKNHDYIARNIDDCKTRDDIQGAVIKQNKESIVFMSSNNLFYCVKYSCDYKYADYFFNGRIHNFEEMTDQIYTFIFIELRKHLSGYLFIRKGFLLHSVSVLFQDKAFALSAPSGTGKSTHANLWVDHFGARIIDGDVNACRIKDGNAYIYGLPWCGSSGIYHNERAALKAVVFIEQASENKVSLLSPTESIMRLTARSFLPQWDIELISGNYLETASLLIEHIKCYSLKCLPDFEAAEVLRQCLY